jgi:hypothetical protein
MPEISPKPREELPVPWTQNPRLLMALDIASLGVVPFWLGLLCWAAVLGNEGQRAYPHYIAITELLTFAVTAPFAGFGIIWLTMRVMLRKVSWWPPVATTHPLWARVILGLVPASFVFGFLLIKIVVAVSNNLF